MPRRKRKRRVFPRGYYSLTEVVQKINNGQVLITPNAEGDAYLLFGWVLSDIEDVYRKLKPRHFYKTAPAKAKPGVYLDFYKATIYGERIYTHFYIDYVLNLLVINSFKEQ